MKKFSDVVTVSSSVNVVDELLLQIADNTLTGYLLRGWARVSESHFVIGIWEWKGNSYFYSIYNTFIILPKLLRSCLQKANLKAM